MTEEKDVFKFEDGEERFVINEDHVVIYCIKKVKEGIVEVDNVYFFFENDKLVKAEAKYFFDNKELAKEAFDRIIREGDYERDKCVLDDLMISCDFSEVAIADWGEDITEAKMVETLNDTIRLIDNPEE